MLKIKFKIVQAQPLKVRLRKHKRDACAREGHEERFKAIFVRLVSKHRVKMKAAVAVQRKLLEMIYTIYETNTPFDKHYLKTWR